MGKVRLARARSVKRKNESPQVKRLKSRVRNLESKLAESVPKAELESLKSSLEAKIRDLEARSAASVPREEADTLQSRLNELESKLAESIPRRDAESELENVRSNLKDEIEQLKEKLAASLPPPTITCRAPNFQNRRIFATSGVNPARFTIACDKK